MLTEISLTEKIIRGLCALEEIYFTFKLERDLGRWLDKYYYRRYKREKASFSRERKRVLEALRRLQKTKDISYSENAQSYQLTPKGWIKYLYSYSRHTPYKKTKKTQSSKKKHLIIFDVPEVYRRFRDIFRRCLQNQGCRMIQKSVFLCPDESVFIWSKKVVANCELDRHVLFIEADKVY